MKVKKDDMRSFEAALELLESDGFIDLMVKTMVYGNVEVYGDAKVYGNAEVSRTT